MLRTWLLVSDLNRERLDPRRQPSLLAGIPEPGIAGLTRA